MLKVIGGGSRFYSCISVQKWVTVAIILHAMSLPFKQARQKAAGCLTVLLNLALPSLCVTQHPAQRGATYPGTGRRGGGVGAHWDPECISNPSVSVSSLSGDIITIAMAAPLGAHHGRRGSRYHGFLPPLSEPLNHWFYHLQVLFFTVLRFRLQVFACFSRLSCKSVCRCTDINNILVFK